jgi:hypothetical protein
MGRSSVVYTDIIYIFVQLVQSFKRMGNVRLDGANIVAEHSERRLRSPAGGACLSLSAFLAM